MKPRILIIDDDLNICELVQIMLQYSNPDYEIAYVSTPEEGLRLAATQRFDLYVLDYRFEGITGIEICRTIRQAHADTSIMFFSGESSEREQRAAMQAGADAYLVKPNHLKMLPETVKQLIAMEKPPSMGNVGLNA